MNLGRTSISATAVLLVGVAVMPMGRATRRGESMMDQKASESAKQVVVTRVFHVPVESVWKAWTEPGRVMLWWGPTGFTTPLANIDFRVGGTSLVCMRAPKEFGGQDMYNTWTYSKIEPLERIEFTLHFADKDGNKLAPDTLGLPPGIPFAVPHVITFKRLGENKTEMTVTESGYASDQAVALSKSGLEECLDKMAKSFEN